MSAFFFPEPAPVGARSNGLGFIGFSMGERMFYRRQPVDPLDLAPLIADAHAAPSFIVDKANYEGIPEKNFCRYFREDGSDFFVGTVSESPFTYPGRLDVIKKWYGSKFGYGKKREGAHA